MAFPLTKFQIMLIIEKESNDNSPAGSTDGQQTGVKPVHGDAIASS